MKIFGRGARSTLVLALCALFLLLAMGLTLLASGVYRNTAADADRHFTQRTALSYLVNQVRRGDTEGGVSAGTFGGADALFLREGGYVTVLYVWDGQLRELYMEDWLGLMPEDGVAVMPLASLSLERQEDSLVFTVSDEDGAAWSAAVRPRCGVGQEGER